LERAPANDGFALARPAAETEPRALLDLPSSLAATGIEEIACVLSTEVWSERAQRAQVQLAERDPFEHYRKSSTYASCRDSSSRRSFTHSQRFYAVRKQRRETQLQVQQALFEFDQVREQLASQKIILANQRRQPRDEFRIRQSHQSILVVHPLCIPCVFRGSAIGLR